MDVKFSFLYGVIEEEVYIKLHQWSVDGCIPISTTMECGLKLPQCDGV